MVSTDRLYYPDCYLTRFEARVARTSGNGYRIYLDRTAFYPTSGGQPHDLGVLGAHQVLDVIDEGDSIAHITDAPVSDQIVECQIDWARRYDHMQQHTGQHLLSAVLVELFGISTLSFHMGPEVSTIELQAPELTDSQIVASEARANEIAREARPVHIRLEEADAAEGLRKPSARSGTLRVIEIEGIDRSACGGTHVRSTAEIAPLQFRKLEKIRGNVRIEFVCGIRALRRAKQDYRIAAELARMGAPSIDALPEYLFRLKERLSDAEKQRHRLEVELAHQQGRALYESTVPGADGLRRALLRLETIDDPARATAQAFTASGRAILLVVATEPAGALVACSPDSGMHAGAVLKEVLSRVGGRGGGSAVLAQGSLPDRGVLQALEESLGFKDGG